MRMLFGPVAVASILVWPYLASADEMQGKIESVNKEQGMIVLENGEALWLAEGVSIESLYPGTEVKVTFEEREDGEKYIGVIEPAE